MKAFVITIDGHSESERASQVCIESSWKVKNEFSINRYEASTPINAIDQMKEFDIDWNYPWQGKVHDFASGLIKSAYQTANPKARIACAMSHFRLWTDCYDIGQDFLILEHDAYFTAGLKQSKIDAILASRFDVIGINNPLGATRKSQQYYDQMQSSKNDVLDVPMIDAFNIPQGLAGNSAYILKPEGAERLLKLVYQYGLWPNDSIMCRQLMPSQLGVTKTSYTAIQHTRSTTTQ